MKGRIFWLEAVNVNGPEIDQVIESLKQHHVSDDPTLIAYKTKFVPTDEYQGEQNVSLAPVAVQASWRNGGFTADWTPADFARMRKVWPKMLAIVDRYYREGVLRALTFPIAGWFQASVCIKKWNYFRKLESPNKLFLRWQLAMRLLCSGWAAKSERLKLASEPISSSSTQIRSQIYAIPARSNMCCTREVFFGQRICSARNQFNADTIRSCVRSCRRTMIEVVVTGDHVRSGDR